MIWSLVFRCLHSTLLIWWSGSIMVSKTVIADGVLHFKKCFPLFPLVPLCLPLFPVKKILFHLMSFNDYLQVCFCFVILILLKNILWHFPAEGVFFHNWSFLKMCCGECHRLSIFAIQIYEKAAWGRCWCNSMFCHLKRILPKYQTCKIINSMNQRNKMNNTNNNCKTYSKYIEIWKKSKIHHRPQS